jgi:PAB-dependent poly(A)-specific ribonuclease subunit 2
MPYYREQLLSAWSNSQVYNVGEPPAKIDPGLLKVGRPYDVGLWAPNPRKGKRNQVEHTRTVEANEATIVAPKFLSEKARNADSEQTSDHEVDELHDILTDAKLSAVTKTDVPSYYRNVEIKYSRFGVDDFDFQ